MQSQFLHFGAILAPKYHFGFAKVVLGRRCNKMVYFSPRIRSDCFPKSPSTYNSLHMSSHSLGHVVSPNSDMRHDYGKCPTIMLRMISDIWNLRQKHLHMQAVAKNHMSHLKCDMWKWCDQITSYARIVANSRRACFACLSEICRRRAPVGWSTFSVSRKSNIK